MTILYVLTGFVIGLAFVRLHNRIERWYLRQQTRGLIDSRLAELNNGRQDQGLTVKIDSIS